MTKPDPDDKKIRSAFAEIKRRAAAEGVSVDDYLDDLLRLLEERRREDVLRRRAEKRKRPS